MTGPEPLRQWCRTCQEATESWHENGQTLCVKCQPPGWDDEDDY